MRIGKLVTTPIFRSQSRREADKVFSDFRMLTKIKCFKGQQPHPRIKWLRETKEWEVSVPSGFFKYYPDFVTQLKKYGEVDLYG
jgi:hypothetical protein